jgi:hypothetical protein
VNDRSDWILLVSLDYPHVPQLDSLDLESLGFDLVQALVLGILRLSIHAYSQMIWNLRFGCFQPVWSRISFYPL